MKFKNLSKETGKFSAEEAAPTQTAGRSAPHVPSPSVRNGGLFVTNEQNSISPQLTPDVPPPTL